MITLKASKQEGITFGIPVGDIVPIVKKMSKASKKDYDINNSKFIANSLFKRLSFYAGINLYAMGLYIEGMNMARDRNLPVEDGLNLVSGKIDQKVAMINKRISPRKINKHLKYIYQQDFLDAEVKEGLIELWKCANEIRDYVDSPRGSLNSYTNKRDLLADQLTKVNDILKIQLNIKDG